MLAPLLRKGLVGTATSGMFRPYIAIVRRALQRHQTRLTEDIQGMVPQNSCHLSAGGGRAAVHDEARPAGHDVAGGGGAAPQREAAQPPRGQRAGSPFTPAVSLLHAAQPCSDMVLPSARAACWSPPRCVLAMLLRAARTCSGSARFARRSPRCAAGLCCQAFPEQSHKLPIGWEAACTFLPCLPWQPPKNILLTSSKPIASSRCIDFLQIIRPVRVLAG